MGVAAGTPDHPRAGAGEVSPSRLSTGGRSLERSLTLARRLPALPLEEEAADEAARFGEGLGRRGLAVGNLDLLIAAVVRRNRGILVTRDRAFQRIPGLHLETY